MAGERQSKSVVMFLGELVDKKKDPVYLQNLESLFIYKAFKEYKERQMQLPQQIVEVESPTVEQ